MLEQHLRMPRRWRSRAPAIPSADTIGYSLRRFELERLRDSLAKIAHLAKRKKALRKLSAESSARNGQWVAALDGHELWSSQRRCCEGCCIRTIKTTEGPVKEYYHRVVILQLVDVWPALILDLEPVLPGEDEVAASLRIVRRVRLRYPKFFKVLTLDALYLQRPFIKQVLDHGLEVIIVLKKEKTALYREALGTMGSTAAKEEKGDSRKSWVWDLTELKSWRQIKPLRVVRSADEITKRERIAGKWSEKIIQSDWIWATTLSKTAASTATIIRWGHARWDIENRGFNELHTHWAMDHCFHHHPTAIQAFLMILALAFALTAFFFDRNLKPAYQKGKSRAFLAQLFCSQLAQEHLEPFLSRAP